MLFPPSTCPRSEVLTQGRICTLLVLLWGAVWGVPCKGEKMVGQVETKGVVA